MMLAPATIPSGRPGVDSCVALDVAEPGVDPYYHIALAMAKALKGSNAAGRPAGFLVPVGPAGQDRHREVPGSSGP